MFINPEAYRKWKEQEIAAIIAENIEQELAKRKILGLERRKIDIDAMRKRVEEKGVGGVHEVKNGI